MTLPPGAREAYRQINRRGLRGVLLCDERDVSYLAATYMACRPWTLTRDLGRGWVVVYRDRGWMLYQRSA